MGYTMTERKGDLKEVMRKKNNIDKGHEHHMQKKNLDSQFWIQ